MCRWCWIIAESPAIKRGEIEPWKSQIKRLAGFSNVHCKISGLLTESDVQNWSDDQLKIYASHIADCFGTHRIMFGSDWPVLELVGKYRDWYDFSLLFTEGWSESEKRSFYHENAIDFYRLSNPPGIPSCLNLANKTALVTEPPPASARAVAETFAAVGASVWIADRDETGGQAVAMKVGGRFLALDVSSDAACAEAAMNVGPAGCAGQRRGHRPRRHVDDTASADLDRLYQVNVRGVFQLLQGVCACDARAKSGRRDKYGFHRRNRCRARTIGLHNDQIRGCRADQGAGAGSFTCWRAFQLHLSMVAWRRHSYQMRLKEYPDPRAAYHEMSATQLTGRMARPEEIAAAALYLAADESAMVTGSAVHNRRRLDGREIAMKIIRYIDPKGTIGYAVLQSDGSALKLAGNCFDILKISHQKAKVVRMLSPIEPSAIICIGLNYRRHALERTRKFRSIRGIFQGHQHRPTSRRADPDSPNICAAKKWITNANWPLSLAGRARTSRAKKRWIMCWVTPAATT